ncbi:disease resistance protein SUMM2-like [Punica granatum]|nr:disease resistance protein SUMM2-like [Punica granatum]XP_031405432.1 disease resistance protein SUMM2-like [Punica granatum]XP_031405441.1 disease resistance protein SUMM2-like [Punica granatum]XP_031405449.1 disease resistance protein SUMM2-like [Punica granatum]XP_031405458.1 disease resistance protein SUMM2-like [Punica granatum]XP_031405466.1 disease resistance protein SUMM2-like [Punica granatum]XP_031405475.1 disease resistance protein SUMM2-like [Punica granatum]PKI65036.1 hypothe
MEIAGVVAGLLNFLSPVSSVPGELSRQFKHVTRLNDEADRLRSRMRELNSRENDIRSELEIAELTRWKKPKSEVQLWLVNVQQMKAEVETIESQVDKELNRCIPNCFSRVRLGKKIVKKTRKIEKHKESGRFPEGLLLDLSAEHGKMLSAAKLIGETTAKRNLEVIWESLMDDDLGKIGVYGMGGVGKTTLMMHVNNRLMQSNSIGSVIWVTASKALELQKLQSDIARALKLDPFPDDEDETGRAAKLLETFRRRKKFVLILDDMWTSYPLYKIGVPEPSRSNCCKIVLTTRLLEVCRGMEVQRVVKVNLLSEEEAWNLFRDRVGLGCSIVLGPEADKIAKLVAAECGRLPLAIVTVGAAMREVEDIREWRTALLELRRSSKNEIKGIETEVFERLKFSYSRLRNDMVRECFLYCALFPDNYRIDLSELIEYWAAEGLIGDFPNREAEKDKCCVIINELKNACLLETAFNENSAECIKMHDMVRDMAIHITRAQNRFMVKLGIGLNKPLQGEEWSKNFERISLMKNNIPVFLGEPRCPKLTTLLVQENHALKNISSYFFCHLAALKVLDMSRTGLEVLPESISHLINLRSLVLRDCTRLKKLPSSFEKLKDLIVLNLSNTGIEILPSEMGNLRNLRNLNLSQTKNLNHVAGGIFSKLSLLEYLSMHGSRWRWPARSDNEEATIEELTFCAHLVSLNIEFLDLEALESYVNSGHWRVLKEFHFRVGSEISTLFHAQLKRSIEISNRLGGVSSLPKNTLELSIKDCHDITHMPPVMLMDLNQLTDCSLSRCNQLEYIFAGKHRNLLESLESLWLWELPNLKAFCKEKFLPGTFENLKALTVYDCSSLKSLFSTQMLLQLQSLEKIEICSCLSMEEIIISDEKDAYIGKANVVILPKLKSLHLDYLPNLKAICRDILICCSLSSVVILECQMLKKLPFSSLNLPESLQNFAGATSWLAKLEWDDDCVKRYFMKFAQRAADN